MSEPCTVDELLSQWERARAEGRLVTAHELCLGHPELLIALQRRIEAVQLMELRERGLNCASVDSTLAVNAAPAEIPDVGNPTLAEGETNSSTIPETELDLRDYELIEELGAGGMGAVYRSCDPALGRDLAIKIIKGDNRDHPDVELRFLREARITGSLQHPGIVAVHNLGRLPDGRLHYTMRLVRGQTFEQILKFEAGKPERLPSLLGIFEKVCQAVAYAHSKHVIHRDLKPGNVMIGLFGEVQVMDWGLAKLLGGEDQAAEMTPDEGGTLIHPESADTPPEATRLGSALGTPAYMSPEQAAGDWEMVDERADVFALGAILCEVLTGAPPYQGKDAAQLLRRARRSDLAEALERLEHCGADTALRTLCCRCLASAREDRPRQAALVVQGVADYQAEVQKRLRQAELDRIAAETRAREEQARAVVEQERTQEALARAAAERRARRRTRALAGALLLLVAGGIAGIVAVNREQHRTATERDQKQYALNALEEEQNKTLAALAAEKRRRVQTRAALDAMSSKVIDDWLSKQNQLSDEQKKYLEQALAAYEEFAADIGQDEEARRGLAGAYLRIAIIRHRLGQTAKAEEAYQRSREQFARLVAEFPKQSKYREGLGRPQSGLGYLLGLTRRLKESEALYRDALIVFKQAAADFPANPRFRQNLSNCHMLLGYLLHMNRRYKEAEVEYHAALVMAKQLVAEFPDNTEFAHTLGYIQFHLSQSLGLHGQWAEAETVARAALAVHEPLVARFPTRSDFRELLALEYHRLGTTLGHLNRPKEREDAYRKALPLWKQLANDFPSMPSYQNGAARALIRLATSILEKEPEQARRLLEEALPYSQLATGADPGNINYLASLYEIYFAQVQVFLNLHDHAAAAAAAEVAEPACHTPIDQYSIACFYSACVKLAEEDAKLSESKRKPLGKSYGDRAMNALRRAIDLGYEDVANLKKDKRLDPLRGRDDFKKLLKKLDSATK